MERLSELLTLSGHPIVEFGRADLIKSHAGRFDTGLLMLVSGLCRFEAGVGSGETRPSFSRSTCRSSSDPCATQFTNYKLAAGAIRASGN